MSERPDPEKAAAWAASLAISEAELAAGKTVPLQPVLDSLRASIERMEAGRVRRQEAAIRSR